MRISALSSVAPAWVAPAPAADDAPQADAVLAAARVEHANASAALDAVDPVGTADRSALAVSPLARALPVAYRRLDTDAAAVEPVGRHLQRATTKLAAAVQLAAAQRLAPSATEVAPDVTPAMVARAYAASRS